MTDEKLTKLSEASDDGIEDLVMKFRALKSYYFTKEAKFQMTKYLFNREFAYLVPKWLKDKAIQGISNISTRSWRVHNVQSFDLILNKYIYGKWVESEPYPRVVNLYYSLAKYKDGVPFQPLDLKERNTEAWKKTHYEHMTGFDLLIDLDARPINNIYYAWHDAREIKRLLDRFQVCHSLRFSGSGFHLLVPSEALPSLSFDPHDDENIYLWQNRLIAMIEKKISCMADSTTWDSRQLCKIPYSLAFMNDRIMLSYEFQDKEEFSRFRLEDFQVIQDEGEFVIPEMMPKNLGFRNPFFFNFANFNNARPIIRFLEYLKTRRRK